MKKIVGVASAVLIALMVSVSLADPPKETPITDRMYSDFNRTCFNNCNASTGHPDDPRWRYLCSCGCDRLIDHCHEVVNKYHLQYVEQVETHSEEYNPTPQDITECKSRAGV